MKANHKPDLRVSEMLIYLSNPNSNEILSAANAAKIYTYR